MWKSVIVVLLLAACVYSMPVKTKEKTAAGHKNKTCTCTCDKKTTAGAVAPAPVDVADPGCKEVATADTKDASKRYGGISSFFWCFF